MKLFPHAGSPHATTKKKHSWVVMTAKVSVHNIIGQQNTELCTRHGWMDDQQHNTPSQ